MSHDERPEPATTLTVEQQQRAEASTRARAILAAAPRIGESPIYSWEIARLAEFILTGEITDLPDDEDDETGETEEVPE